MDSKHFSGTNMAKFFPQPRIVNGFVIKADVHGDEVDPSIVKVIGIEDELYRIPRQRLMKLKVPVAGEDWEYVERHFTKSELRDWLAHLKQSRRVLERYIRSIEDGIDRLEHITDA